MRKLGLISNEGIFVVVDPNLQTRISVFLDFAGLQTLSLCLIQNSNIRDIRVIIQVSSIHSVCKHVNSTCLFSVF